MDGRETDDDDTLERHTDTNKLTGHTASWAATHPEWAYTSLKATFPLPPPPSTQGAKSQTTAERKKTDKPNEGWEDGTPPPHRDFSPPLPSRSRAT